MKVQRRNELSSYPLPSMKLGNMQIAQDTPSTQNNNLSGWLITAGYIEALKDMLACFEG